MKRVLLAVLILLLQGPAAQPTVADGSDGEAASEAAGVQARVKQLVSFAENDETTTDEDAPARTISVRRLIGMRVINPLNEDIGVVADLLVDQYGCPAGMVIQVGGFMGFGGEYVRIAIDKVNIRPNTSSSAMTVMVRETRQNMLSGN